MKMMPQAEVEDSCVCVLRLICGKKLDLLAVGFWLVNIKMIWFGKKLLGAVVLKMR